MADPAVMVREGSVRDMTDATEFQAVLTATLADLCGGKSALRPLGEPVTCGGVRVTAGDVVVADEEGVVVVPADRRGEVPTAARAGFATGLVRRSWQ
jgi:4-hydroxy-4-methyl-2-oxoglutarate aldolase